MWYICRYRRPHMYVGKQNYLLQDWAHMACSRLGKEARGDILHFSVVFSTALWIVGSGKVSPRHTEYHQPTCLAGRLWHEQQETLHECSATLMKECWSHVWLLPGCHMFRTLHYTNSNYTALPCAAWSRPMRLRIFMLCGCLWLHYSESIVSYRRYEDKRLFIECATFTKNARSHVISRPRS